MLQYSLIDRRPEEEVLSFLQGKNIGVLARGSLAKGILVSKPAEPFLNYSKDEVGRARNALQSVSTKQLGLADRAFHFVLDHPAISAAVIGIRTEQQLREALDAGKSPALNHSQLEILRNALPPNAYADHR
jgi:aryl-alcohol dehydrogenase-like predicted oxidoreductase